MQNLQTQKSLSQCGSSPGSGPGSCSGRIEDGKIGRLATTVQNPKKSLEASWPKVKFCAIGT